MATASQIATGASNFDGLSNKLSAIIYLLNTNNMTPAQIAQGAAQFDGMANKEACIIYLLSIGGAVSGGVPSGNYGGGPPNFTPTTASAVAIDSSNGTLWEYYNGAWH